MWCRVEWLFGARARIQGIGPTRPGAARPHPASRGLLQSPHFHPTRPGGGKAAPCEPGFSSF